MNDLLNLYTFVVSVIFVLSIKSEQRVCIKYYVEFEKSATEKLKMTKI